MKRYCIVFLLAILCMLDAEAKAANWYVRPNGASYGTSTGANWTNAWSGFAGINWSSVACGDTIWVAGGDYSQNLQTFKNCTSGSQLFVRRARGDAAESTGASGWSVALNATIKHSGSIVNGNGNWYTVSGATSANPAAFGSYGWVITKTGTACSSPIDFPNGATASNLKFEYLSLQGPAANWTGDCRGIDDTPFSSATNHTFSHLQITGFESGMYVAGTQAHVSEYIDMSNIRGNATIHPNLYYIINSSNGTIRYSRFHHSAASGTGIAFSDGGVFNNWMILGNSFYRNNQSSGTAINVQESAIVGLKLYNNTFNDNGINLYLSGGATCSTGSESKNNITYGSGGSVNCGTSSNNMTISSSPNPFVNLAGDDYNIISTTGASYPRNAGTSLPLNGFFEFDASGNRRGADGVWDVGAFEATGVSAGLVPPPPPTNLTVN